MAWIKVADYAKPTGEQMAVLFETSLATFAKTLNFTSASALIPQARSFQVMSLALQVTTSAVAGTRTVFWGMHEDTQQSAVVTGAQFPYNISTVSTLHILTADPTYQYLPSGWTPAKATAAHPVVPWRNSIWVTFPWGTNCIVTKGFGGFNDSALTVSLDNAQAGDQMFPTILCRYRR